IPLLRFLGATSSGVVDPLFGRDLSFYLLALPLYDDIADIIIAIICVSIALWVGIGTVARSGTAAFVSHPAAGGAFHPYGIAAIPSPWSSRSAWTSWTRQGMVLGALLCATLGISRF